MSDCGRCYGRLLHITRYNLTIARPQGFLHSSAFIEVRDSLAWALTELGHSADCTENHLSLPRGVFGHSDDTINILFGAETLTGTEQIPQNTILYNLEQPAHPRMDLVRELARGRQVWDFSQRNIETWKAIGIDAHFLPVSYTPYLTRIPPAENQDVDVLFYGWLTPRRMEMKRRLEEMDRNWKVVFTDQAYGGGRDNLIARAKVCVNIHHDGRTMTEIVRLSYLLANRKCVIAENSSDDADYEHLRLQTVHYDNLPPAVAMAVNEQDFRTYHEQQGFERFSKDRLVDHLKRVLDDA